MSEKVIRHIVLYKICDFVKKTKQLIKKWGPGQKLGTEPGNELKYQEEIENAYNELVH